jgi:hypothetical protein
MLGLSAALMAAPAARASGRAGRRSASAQATPATRAETLPRFAYVGSFATSTRGAHGEGLSVYAIDAATDLWSRVQLLSNVVNPGYLTLHPHRPVLYAVQPVANVVSAFAIDNRSGQLALINSQPSGGDDPSHVAIDPTGKFLVAANYVAGTVEFCRQLRRLAQRPRTWWRQRAGHRTRTHPHQCPFVRRPVRRGAGQGFDRPLSSPSRREGQTGGADPPFTNKIRGGRAAHRFPSPTVVQWVINERTRQLRFWVGTTGPSMPFKSCVASDLHRRQRGAAGASAVRCV